ncbi:hypothetical protein KCP69_19140 [Salmonella enterica subsp. enterica]|nr:hypothetical protein KCP69_19140 [Salmonella enterica subsp. enterica]
MMRFNETTASTSFPQPVTGSLKTGGNFFSRINIHVDDDKYRLLAQISTLPEYRLPLQADPARHALVPPG